MNVMNAFVLFMVMLFSAFPQPAPQSSAKQVLGETTTQQMTAWKEKVRQILGCEYETTCREFCAKPENTERCTYFFSHYSPQNLTGTGSGSLNTGYLPLPTVRLTSTPYPTKTAQYYPLVIETPKVGSNEGKPLQYSSSKIIYPTSTVKIEYSRQPTPQLLRYTELKQLTATSSSELKEQFRKAYLYIQQSKIASKEALIQRLNSEYMTALSHEEDHIKSTAQTFSSAESSEKIKIEKAKAQFKANIAKIKNEKKKVAVQAIDTKITALNYKAVETMNSAVNKLSSLLTSLNNQMFSIAQANQDVMAIQLDSLEAQSLITAAQQAILAQTSKSYVLPIASDEAKLKGEISPVVALFRKDLEGVHKTVIQAKDAVEKVYKEIYQLKSQNGLVTPKPTTTSGSSSIK